MLSVQELAARLGDGITDIGVGWRDAEERHRTLRATIEWSYGMLDERLQRTFVDFAVFAGGATLEAVREVAGADLGIVEALIAKSLIRRRQQPNGATRCDGRLRPRRRSGLRLSGQLGRYWGLRDDLEGLQWLDAALLATDERAPITDRARARLHHAHQLRLRNQGAAAIDEMQTALALYRHATITRVSARR